MVGWVTILPARVEELSRIFIAVEAPSFLHHPIWSPSATWTVEHLKGGPVVAEDLSLRFDLNPVALGPVWHLAFSRHWGFGKCDGDYGSGWSVGILILAQTVSKASERKKGMKRRGRDQAT